MPEEKTNSRKNRPRQRSGQHPPRRKNASGGRRAAEIVVSLILVAAVVFVGVRFFRSLEPISSDVDMPAAESSEEESATEPPTEPQMVYDNISVDNTQASAGSLILVNSSYAYTEMDADEITSIYEYKNANNVTSYSVNSVDTSLRLEAIENISEMLDDFYVATGHDDIIILSAYRTFEEQQQLYDNDLTSTGLDYSDLVAEPGHSEHETGYAVDFSIYQDGAIYDYDGSEDYAWINQNCAHYGFILRYTLEKENLTDIQAEPWHYRYVGQPHATYMMDNNLCLEEYINLVKHYDAENPLQVTNWDGEVYDVYYAAADTSADTTYVLVQSGANYTISGCNAGGFVITVDTGEVATYQPVETTTTAESSTDETTTTAEDSAE